MTPTAQIEAAAKALVHEYEHPASGDGDLWSKVQALKAALAAAEEIARQGRIANWGHPATAEVGLPPIKDFFADAMLLGQDLKIEERAMLEQRDHTIERCAQVAERQQGQVAKDIAADIRALKDKDA